MIERLIYRILYFLPPLLFALSFHESAHALIAYRFGDPTARDQGRITLNPLPHIDPIGLIAILFAPIGWAKPVMINPYNLKDPIKDNIWISLAGPASNLILAFIFGIIFRIVSAPLSSSVAGQYFSDLIQISVLLNISLMVFNLIPIPPLDGFHILEGIVPTETYVRLQRVRMFGPLLLVVFVVFFGNVLMAIINPIYRILGGFLLGIPI